MGIDLGAIYAAVVNWVGGLPQGAAPFFGSLIGNFLGLFSLVIAALLNASLNRKRDDRLRWQEEQSIAAAVYAEIRHSQVDLASRLENQCKRATSIRFFKERTFLIDAPAAVIVPAIAKELGRLSPAVLYSISAYSAHLNDYRQVLGDLTTRLEDDTRQTEMLVLASGLRVLWFAQVAVEEIAHSIGRPAQPMPAGFLEVRQAVDAIATANGRGFWHEPVTEQLFAARRGPIVYYFWVVRSHPLFKRLQSNFWPARWL